MKYWYVELQLSDEQNEKLKKWEKERNEEAETLLHRLLNDFLESQ